MNQPVSNISVVICCYTMERWQDIQDAVQSLKIQTVQPHEVILVVDHNQELLKIAQDTFTGVKIVENSEARGLSGARNIGIAIATGELIAFLDDDATAEIDWLEKLNAACANPNAMGAGGFVEPEWVDGKPAWFPAEFNWVVGCTYTGTPKVATDIRNPLAGGACFRREVFEKAGGFRDGIGRIGTKPLGGEETELSIRAKQYMPNRIFRYDPAARIHHRVPGKRANWKYFISRCYHEGMSKAVIAQIVGRQDGLSSERAYTFKTLPLGVLRGLGDTVFHFDLGGLGRATAIVAGLSATVYGYAEARVSQAWAKRQGKTSLGETLAKQPVFQVQVLKGEEVHV